MPCNRRFQQHPAFGCHPGAAYGHSFPAGALFAAFMEEMEDAVHPASKDHKVRSSDNEESHVVRMDIPGVQPGRISIEEKNGEIEITAVRMLNEHEVAKVYQEVFYLNPFRYDIDQAKATLTNGVLTLTIPKNQAGTVKEFAVEVAPVPTDLPTSNLFHHTMDLPGVSASSLQVKLNEDRVHLVGKRSLGDYKRVLVQRSFEVPPSMDTLQARALLQDGVFTFLAPIHESQDNQLRTIWVQEEAEMEVEASTAPAMAQMKIADNEEDTKPKEDAAMEEDQGDINVETVDEEDAAEAKDTDSWEEVRRSA